MIKKKSEKYNLISIECLLKKENSNQIKLELVNNKEIKKEIYFEFFWQKDTPESIIIELLNDTNIEIYNKHEFIDYLKIFNTKDFRITKIKRI